MVLNYRPRNIVDKTRGGEGEVSSVSGRGEREGVREMQIIINMAYYSIAIAMAMTTLHCSDNILGGECSGEMGPLLVMR